MEGVEWNTERGLFPDNKVLYQLDPAGDWIDDMDIQPDRRDGNANRGETERGLHTYTGKERMGVKGSKGHKT
jgi:hypothetical protein